MKYRWSSLVQSTHLFCNLRLSPKFFNIRFILFIVFDDGAWKYSGLLFFCSRSCSRRWRNSHGLPSIKCSLLVTSFVGLVSDGWGIRAVDCEESNVFRRAMVRSPPTFYRMIEINSHFFFPSTIEKFHECWCWYGSERISCCHDDFSTNIQTNNISHRYCCISLLLICQSLFISFKLFLIIFYAVAVFFASLKACIIECSPQSSLLIDDLWFVEERCRINSR